MNPNNLGFNTGKPQWRPRQKSWSSGRDISGDRNITGVSRLGNQQMYGDYCGDSTHQANCRPRDGRSQKQSFQQQNYGMKSKMNVNYRSNMEFPLAQRQNHFSTSRGHPSQLHGVKHSFIDKQGRKRYATRKTSPRNRCIPKLYSPQIVPFESVVLQNKSSASLFTHEKGQKTQQNFIGETKCSTWQQMEEGISHKKDFEKIFTASVASKITNDLPITEKNYTLHDQSKRSDGFVEEGGKCNKLPVTSMQEQLNQMTLTAKEIPVRIQEAEKCEYGSNEGRDKNRLCTSQSISEQQNDFLSENITSLSGSIDNALKVVSPAKLAGSNILHSESNKKHVQSVEKLTSSDIAVQQSHKLNKSSAQQQSHKLGKSSLQQQSDQHTKHKVDEGKNMSAKKCENLADKQTENSNQVHLEFEAKSSPFKGYGGLSKDEHLTSPDTGKGTPSFTRAPQTYKEHREEKMQKEREERLRLEAKRNTQNTFPSPQNQLKTNYVRQHSASSTHSSQRSQVIKRSLSGECKSVSKLVPSSPGSSVKKIVPLLQGSPVNKHGLSLPGSSNSRVAFSSTVNKDVFLTSNTVYQHSSYFGHGEPMQAHKDLSHSVNLQKPPLKFDHSSFSPYKKDLQQENSPKSVEKMQVRESGDSFKNGSNNVRDNCSQKQKSSDEDLPGIYRHRKSIHTTENVSSEVKKSDVKLSQEKSGLQEKMSKLGSPEKTMSKSVSNEKVLPKSGLHEKVMSRLGSQEKTMSKLVLHERVLAELGSEDKLLPQSRSQDGIKLSSQGTAISKSESNQKVQKFCSPVIDTSGQISTTTRENFNSPVTVTSGQISPSRENFYSPVIGRSGQSSSSRENFDSPVTGTSGQISCSRENFDSPIKGTSGQSSSTRENFDSPVTGTSGQISSTRENSSFRAISMISDLDDDIHKYGSDLDIDIEDSDDDDLKTPAFLVELENAWQKPVPRTPPPRLHGSPLPCNSPVPIHISKSSNSYSNVYSLDALLAEETEKTKEQVEIEEIYAKLEHGVRMGGFVKDTLEKEEEPVHGELLPEQRDQIRQLEVQDSVLKCCHPGEKVFNSHQYQTLFTASISPQECGFSPGTSYIDKHLASLLPGDYSQIFTSHLLMECLEAVSDTNAILRWIFLYMSIEKSSLAVKGCFDILEEYFYCEKNFRDSDEHSWSPSVADVLSVFCNYGGDKDCFLPTQVTELPTSAYPVMYQQNMAGVQDDLSCYCKENMRLVLVTLTLALQERPRYTAEELTHMLIILCTAALDESLTSELLTLEFQCGIGAIVKKYSETDWERQRDVLCRVLPSLTNHHHNMVYISRLLPLGERGMYIKRRVCYCFLRRIFNMDISDLDLESVKIKCLKKFTPLLYDIIDDEMYKVSSCLNLLDLCVGNAAIKTSEKDDLSNFTDQIKKLSGEIRENVRLLDRSRLKDLMVRLTSKWTLLLIACGSKQKTLFAYANSNPQDIKIKTVEVSLSDEESQSDQSETEMESTES